MQCCSNDKHYPDSKVHRANMGSTWVLSAPDGPPCWPHEPCYQGIFMSFVLVFCFTMKKAVSKNLCNSLVFTAVFWAYKIKYCFALSWWNQWFMTWKFLPHYWPFVRESTGNLWFSVTKMPLMFFFFFLTRTSLEQTIELPMTSDTLTLKWHQCNE